MSGVCRRTSCKIFCPLRSSGYAVGGLVKEEWISKMSKWSNFALRGAGEDVVDLSLGDVAEVREVLSLMSWSEER